MLSPQTDQNRYNFNVETGIPIVYEESELCSESSLVRGALLPPEAGSG